MSGADDFFNRLAGSRTLALGPQERERRSQQFAHAHSCARCTARQHDAGLRRATMPLRRLRTLSGVSGRWQAVAEPNASKARIRNRHGCWSSRR